MTPVDADFVPPPPEEVPRLVDELADYCSGGVHSALVQAALVHAQFETVHPFADGNGRVGRALIHTVLRRRGLVAASVLPVSLVLQTRVDDYVRGLTAFRHDGPPDGPAARDGLVEWVDVFVEASAQAVDRALELAAAVDATQQDWTRRLEQVRSDEGLRATPRADSAAGRLVALLPETPVVTVRTAAAALGTSENAARKALETLLAAGVVRTKRVGRATAYLADDVPGAARARGPLLYGSSMTEVAVSEARERLAEVIEGAHRSGEPVWVTRRGRRVAVVLDPDVFDRLVEAAEDAEDRAELRAAPRGGRLRPPGTR